MTDDLREQIALFRFKLISPILAEPVREQNAYFRAQAERVHDCPHYGLRRFSVSTFKGWLRRYREKGRLAALEPQPRADQGRPRKLQGAALDALRVKCKAFPHWTAKMLYEQLLREDQLGTPPICYNTLLRIVKREDLLPKKGRKDVRKRYEVDCVNDLWVADFLHGPTVRMGNTTRKIILCAIIDDHTRMIVGAVWSPHETLSVLTVALKEAFLAYGIPRRLYVDNGAAFSADLLAKSCADARVALIHSKPYDAPSRGKVERFFRTVRERFLAGLAKDVTFDDLEHAFHLWLRDEYHHRQHAGIDERPIDRYQASVRKTDIRRLSKAELDQIFLVRHQRTVSNAATIDFKNRLYEVPAAYIRQKVELRHPVDDPDALALYDRGVFVTRLRLLDLKENARTFRPEPAQTACSFARKEVEP